VELEEAKAALVGMKHVISGVLLMLEVRFAESLNCAKVVWLSAVAVSVINSGRVK
jgi:hypothetical protein